MIKVMVADDNVNFCNLLSEVFSQQEDIKLVGTANNGLDAVDKIAELKPDVLVLDIIMPHLDGLGVLERISGYERRPRVIVLTGLGHESITQQALRLGADYYVLKPFNIDVLVKRIRELNSQETQTAASASLESRNPYSATPKPEAPDLETEITDMLHEMGVPAHIKGYQYLRRAIEMVIEDNTLLNAITKCLYPELAEQYHTTPNRVERAIRHAIETAWDRNEMEMVEQVFRSTYRKDKGKPTNAEFISMIADKLRLRMKKYHRN